MGEGERVFPLAFMEGQVAYMDQEGQVSLGLLQGMGQWGIWQITGRGKEEKKDIDEETRVVGLKKSKILLDRRCGKKSNNNNVFALLK